MQRNKAALVVALLAFFVFSSCQKEKGFAEEAGRTGGDNTYYIKGKRNGEPFNYTSLPMARIDDYSSAGQFFSVSLMASATSPATSLESFGVVINFFDGAVPATGVYKEDYAGNEYVVVGVYNPNSQVIVWAAGAHYPTVKPLTVNILTKTATEMTGTIEGAFYKQDNQTAVVYDDYLLFTECSFRLPIIK